MSRNDLAGSHIPLLVKAVQNTRGTVLELGMGWNSTPLLHWMCQDRDRNLFSFETDLKWADNFKDYNIGRHIFQIIEKNEWETFYPFDTGRVGLAFIDCRPAIERHRIAYRMRDLADIILIHDSEPEIERFYAYSRIYKHFKYRYDYNKYKPYTTALSNTIDVERILS